MRRWIIIAVLLFIALLASAQTPPQFTGLLTDSTDYTIDGGVWTYPAIPNPGACYYDATWKVYQCRIAAVTDCPVNSTYNPSGDCAITNTKMLVDYAKTVPWSVDDSYYAADSLGWIMLYTVSSGTYTFLRTLRTYCGAVAGTCLKSYGATRDYGSSDASFGGTLWGDFSNWLWASNASTPHVMYYTGSSAADTHRFQLKAYNADTDTISVVHDFTATINTVNGWGTCGVTATGVDMQREGNQSDDDRYWAFGVTDGSSSGWCAVLVYDKTADSVIALSTLAAGGMCGASACSDVATNGYPNWVGMSPSGNYVMVNWQTNSNDSTWVRGHGTEAFDRSLNFLGVASAGNGHGDVGYDVNGVEVYVDHASISAGTYTAYQFGMCNLANLTSVPGPTGLGGGCQHYFALPCTWGVVTCPFTTLRNNTFFISMRGSHGAAQGWALLSTQTAGGAGQSLPTGNGGFGALENDAFLINWAAGGTTYNNGSVPAASLVRLGRNHGILVSSTPPNQSYNAQSNAAPNHYFTKFAWSSTWDVVPPWTPSTALTVYSMYTELSLPAASTPAVFTGTLTSNSDSTGIVATPARKQLTNCATDYSGGVLQPVGVPVGQLYCTAAAKTAGEGHGGPVQGIVTATASGTGIAAVDNGQSAGGTDSPSAMTDTYGGAGDDAVCTGDPNNGLPTIISGVPPATCVANSSAVFSETSAIGFPFPDTLWPSDYASDSLALDVACCYYRDTYFQVPTVATTHVLEMDVNLNSSSTAYAAGRGAYFGWGFQYNMAAQSFQYCPQNCSNWVSLRGIDVTRVHADLTTYVLTNNHWYHIRTYGHRTPGCTFTKGVNCFFYDYLTINDVTAAVAPVTYKLVDATTGAEAGGIPVDKHTWAAGPDMQVQIDMTTANATASAHIVSDTTTIYNGNVSGSAGAFWF